MYGVSSEVKQQQHRYVTALDLISHWTLLKLGQDISAVFVCSDTTENRTAPVLSRSAMFIIFLFVEITRNNG